MFGSGTDKWLVSDADKAEHVARTVADTLGGDIGAPCDVYIANTYDAD